MHNSTELQNLAVDAILAKMMLGAEFCLIYVHVTKMFKDDRNVENLDF